MVKNSREKACPGPIRPLNSLKPVRVTASDEGWPQAIGSRPILKVASVEDRWRIDDEWWRGSPISRIYHQCVLEDGRKMTLCQDLNENRWYTQRD